MQNVCDKGSNVIVIEITAQAMRASISKPVFRCKIQRNHFRRGLRLDQPAGLFRIRAQTAGAPKCVKRTGKTPFRNP